MSIAEKEKSPLELLADHVVQGRFAMRAVRWSQLNPEQQLAYVLEQLVKHKEGEIALLQTSTLLAAACVEWRKTPEGQAWMAKQAAKRAAADASKVQT